MQKLQKNIIIFIFIVLFLSIGLIIKGYQENQSQQDLNQKIANRINKTQNYLSQNYNKYPYPQGNIIYLDKNLEQIHLKDKNKSIKSITNLKYIQGSLCSISNLEENLGDSITDPRFSTGANKKCFTYSVDKDQKDYQIGYVLEKNGQYVGYLTGTSKKNIIKDYKSNSIVQNNQSSFLPYGPYIQNKIKLINKYGQADGINIKEDNLKINPQYIKNKNLKDEGILLPVSDETQKIDLTLKGKNFNYQLVYPDGTLQYLSPNDANEIKISIKDFKFATNRSQATIINQLGKMAYSFVKLGKDTNYNIQDQNQGKMVIRGTKFNLDIGPNISSIFLSKGKIDYTKPTKDYTINSLEALGFDKDNKLIDLAKKKSQLEGLYNYSIGIDSISNSKSNYTTSLEKKLNLNKKINEIKPFSQTASKDQIKLSNIVKLKDQNKEYHLINLKGRLDAEKLFNYSIKNKSFNLNNELSKICEVNGYKKTIDINQAYKFLNFNKVLKNDIIFNINPDLKPYIPEGFVIYFKTISPNSLNITYYDPAKTKKTINSIGISQVYKTNGEGKKGISIICEK